MRLIAYPLGFAIGVALGLLLRAEEALTDG